MRFLLLLSCTFVLSSLLTATEVNAQIYRLHHRASGCQCYGTGYYPPASWQTQLNFSYPSTYDPRPSSRAQSMSGKANTDPRQPMSTEIAGTTPPPPVFESSDDAAAPAKVEPDVSEVTSPAPSILAAAASRPNLSTLVMLAKFAGIAKDLEGPGPLTIFANQ